MRESKKDDLWQKIFSFLINTKENHSEKSQLFHAAESKTVFTTTAIKSPEFAIIKLPDQDPPELKNQYHELCKSSSLLWWKRFFDIGYYLGQVPYRIVPKDHNSYEFTLVETRLNKVISLICQILTLLGSWNILAQLTSSAKPRIPNLLSWVSDFGTFCIQLSIYYTIWFKKAEIIHLLNTYLLSWKCWQEEKRSRYYCKQRKNKTSHVRLTTCYGLFFGALCLSYFYELGRDSGWSLRAVFFRSCALNLIFSSNSCSKDTISWQDIPFTAVKFSAWKLNQIMAILCDMFFLSSCIFYGRFNDEIGQFPEEDDYETAEKNYTRLRTLNRALSDAAGFAVLMIVVGGLPFYVGHMPEIVATYINNSLNSSQYRVFIFLTYYFGIFFWTSLKLSNVEYRLKLWAERRDMVSTQMAIPFRYQVFHLDIQTNTKLEFAPCGIFKFNYDFCKALLSFAATYSIILVQMGQSNSDVKGKLTALIYFLKLNDASIMLNFVEDCNSQLLRTEKSCKTATASLTLPIAYYNKFLVICIWFIVFFSCYGFEHPREFATVVFDRLIDFIMESELNHLRRFKTFPKERGSVITVLPGLENQVYDTSASQPIQKELLLNLPDCPEYEELTESTVYQDLCHNSSLLWWKRFFDLGYYFGYVPYQFVLKRQSMSTPASFAFDIVQNNFNTTVSIICMTLTIMASSNTVREPFFPAEPRYDFLQWIADVGTLSIQLGMYYTIWFRKTDIFKVFNDYVCIWKTRHDDNFHLRCTTCPGKSTNHFRLSTLYWLFFAVTGASYWFELGYSNGWSIKDVFKSVCSESFLFAADSCSSDTFLWRYISRFLINFFSMRCYILMVIAGDMFFLSSCILYGRCLDEIGRFQHDEDYQAGVNSYARLRHIVALINDTVGLPVFFIVVGGMPYYVGRLPELVGNYVNNLLNLSQARNMIFFSYYFGIFAWTSAKYHQVQKRLELWLELQEKQLKMATPFDFHVFHSELNTNSKLVFAPCGIFRLNYEFCKALLNFAATYSLIIVQMRQHK